MAPVSESGDFYHGSRLLTPLVSVLGLSIDQVTLEHIYKLDVYSDKEVNLDILL